MVLSLTSQFAVLMPYSVLQCVQQMPIVKHITTKGRSAMRLVPPAWRDRHPSPQLQRMFTFNKAFIQATKVNGLSKYLGFD